MISSKAPKIQLMLVFLLLLNIINMIDRTLLASFGSEIIEDLNLTDSQFGLLTGLVFVFFYSVMGLFMGALADRFHRPRLIAIGLVIWSGLTLLSGMAKNFLQIGLARLFIGVGESAMTPSAISIISDLFPKEQRGTACGIYYLGVPIGAGASFIIAGVLGPMIGWRNTFILLGAIGLVLALILVFIEDPKRGMMDAGDNVTYGVNATSSNSVKEIISGVFHILKTSPVVFWGVLGAIFLHVPIGAGQFAIVWIERERNFEVGEITALYGLVYIVFGTAGTFFGGLLSDLYQKRYKGGRLRFLAYLMISIIPFTISYRFADSSSILFYSGMAAGIFSISSFYGPAFSTIQDNTSVHFRGVMTGVLLVACNLIGLGFGALITGFLSDLFAHNEVFEPLTKALIISDIISIGAPVCFMIASLSYISDSYNGPDWNESLKK